MILYDNGLMILYDNGLMILYCVQYYMSYLNLIVKKIFLHYMLQNS